MIKLFELIRFSKLLKDFAEVERVVLKPGKNKWENDAEHSFDLAMLSWYIADVNKLKLKKDLIMKYALAHDLVEVYAGDTFFFDNDKNRDSKKFKREKSAAQKLKKRFPQFHELHQLIKNYEGLVDKEARFVYALDKVVPIINIYLDNGRTWKRKNISIKMLWDGKIHKVAVSPEVEKYFRQIIALLKKEERQLFKNKFGK